MDPIETFKAHAKETWSGFGALENLTASVAPRLVRFAQIGRDDRVLDVGCGTGVVALTAARTGARVTGVDLTPALLERAREHSGLLDLSIEWHEGDAEALPFEEASFDVVVSQFGHIFAPRSAMATRELLRVLRPGGRLAFSSWPPELYAGRMFQLTGRYGPPLPAGFDSPVAWGDPHVVRERLGDRVTELTFDRDVMWIPTLSPRHYRVFAERSIGPLQRLVAELERSNPAGLASFRAELDALVGSYFEDNHVRQDYLLTRATKA